MCGEVMRLRERERLTTVPGTRETVRAKVAEWECAECDSFEEADEEGERS